MPSALMTPAQIREARQALGLTQRQFAVLLGYPDNDNSRRNVTRWESGEKKPISLALTRLKKILRERNITLDP